MSQQAYTLPQRAPLYQAPPFDYKAFSKVSVFCRVDEAAIRAALPAQFDIRGDVIEFFIMDVPAGGSQGPMLPLLLQANGLKESDMTLMNMPVAAMVPSLLQGQVDAILGSSDAYQIQLEMQGAELTNFAFADNGVPTVATSIFASNDFLKQHPDVVKKFIAASLKGWTFALANPAKSIEHLKAIFPDVNVKLATAELAAITPLFCSGDAKYIGKAEDAHWTRTQKLLSEVKLLPEGQDPKSYYTNDFLPPDGELKACK